MQPWTEQALKRSSRFAAALLCFGACVTTPQQATPASGLVPTVGPFDDALLSASVEAQLDAKYEPVAMGLLKKSCAANESLACAVLLRRIGDGEEKRSYYKKLKAKRSELGRFAWATLVFEGNGDERRQLAREALIKFPTTDLFYSAADYVPQTEIGLKTFVDNPTYMTLLALGVGLIRDDRWALLDKAMHLALYSGIPDIVESPEYWILRGRVASRLERLDLAWAYAAVGALITSKGRNQPGHLLNVARQAARHEDTVDLLPIILELPAAQRIVGKQELLLTGLRLHRAKVRREAQQLLAPSVGKDVSPFGGGLLAALVATRYEPDARKRRQLLAEAVIAAPDNLQTWVRLSMAEDELKNTSEAIGALRNALRVDSDEPESLNNLAYMLAVNRPADLQEAERFARRSLLLLPRPATLDTLAEIRFRRGDRVGALRLIRLAKRLDPKSKFYQRQEARIDAGDPKMPIPSEEE